MAAPSLIRCAHVGATTKEYLIIFIVVQNLVGIDGVVLIVIMQFQYFVR